MPEIKPNIEDKITTIIDSLKIFMKYFIMTPPTLLMSKRNKKL